MNLPILQNKNQYNDYQIDNRIISFFCSRVSNRNYEMVCQGAIVWKKKRRIPCWIIWRVIHASTCYSHLIAWNGENSARALHRVGDRIRGIVPRLYIIRRWTLVLLLSLKTSALMRCAWARYIGDDFAPSWKRKPKVFLESPIS